MNNVTAIESCVKMLQDKGYDIKFYEQIKLSSQTNKNPISYIEFGSNTNGIKAFYANYPENWEFDWDKNILKHNYLKFNDKDIDSELFKIELSKAIYDLWIWIMLLPSYEDSCNNEFNYLRAFYDMITDYNHYNEFCSKYAIKYEYEDCFYSNAIILYSELVKDIVNVMKDGCTLDWIEKYYNNILDSYLNKSTPKN